jgi:hypothetical protein
MTDIVVFVGPSLSGASVSLEGLQVRPPAAQGDLYRAALRRPAVIALIDGVFGHRPAVWHKEVLWALSKGIQVVGGASMGALRAAELSSFGMVGVGQIFRSYEAGECNDDDEVALLHADAGGGYRPLTEPMVNVRATVAAARAAEVSSPLVSQRLVSYAKQIHYTERTWACILDAGLDEIGWDVPGRAAFSAWLATGRVDQKRSDAEHVLAVAREMGRASEREELPNRPPQFEFEYTDAWHKMAAAVEAEEFASDEHVRIADILDELRLIGEGTFRLVLEAALARALAAGDGRTRGNVSDAQVQARIEAERRARGLYTVDELRHWLDAGDESADELSDRIRMQLQVERLLDDCEAVVMAEVPRVVRAHPALRGVIARARRKHEALAQRDLAEPSLNGTGLTESDLVRSYFVDVRRQPVPRDLAAYARILRLDSRHQLMRLLLREYWFAHANGA